MRVFTVPFSASFIRDWLSDGGALALLAAVYYRALKSRVFRFVNDNDSSPSARPRPPDRRLP
ncbi:hypothetical protein ACSNOI_39360 [Actinomadura kijaniata]|uniref:hypothetical protein n=1 Tax=Actinomadura kijaniata TaxID=46161 RepID=UPI003F1ACA9D